MLYLLGFVIAVAVLMIHIVLHELSHALMAKAIAPSEILRFKFWPHIWRDWLYMGRIEISSLETFNPLERCYFYGAPLILNSILLFVYALLGGWFWCAAIISLIDSIFWVACAIFKVPNNDGSMCIAAWKEVQHEYTRTNRSTEA